MMANGVGSVSDEEPRRSTVDITASVPVLPENAILEYLDEGAANIVYRISVPSGTGGDPASPDAASRAFDFEPYLLRLRKSLPHTTPAQIAHANHVTHIAPLFPPSDVVSQHLVSLPPGLIPKLNLELQSWEEDELEPPEVPSSCPRKKRPEKRRGVYLADDEFGLLVEDQRPQEKGGAIGLEFKPKWLCQSPSAPEEARRCRTCAKRAMDHAKSRGEEKEPGRKGFCPLDLVSDGEARVKQAVMGVLEVCKSGNLAGTITPDVMERLVHFFLTSSLLHRLRSEQERLDPLGVFNTDTDDLNLRIAMTLRDCSVYLTVPIDGHGEVRAKLGDLDLKSAEKGVYWRGLERALVDGGWYVGMEKEERGWGVDCQMAFARDQTEL